MISRDYLVITCDISQERLESDIIIFGVRVHLLVAHAAVNRGVVGSSPTRGVPRHRKMEYGVPYINTRLRGQAVKTSPFHGGNTGSIPVGVIKRFVCA